MNTPLPRNSSIVYVPALDGLRGLAVLLVLLYHARVPGFMGGLLGVDLFFVLSGYLITSLLIHEHAQTGAIHLARFYLRRAYRILPALVSFVAVGLMVSWLMLPGLVSAQLLNAFYILTFSYNWIIAFLLTPEEMKLALHCWTLAVEMQYYLIWPLVVSVFLRRKKIRALRLFLIGMIVLSFTLRLYFAYIGTSFDRVYFATDTRLDGFSLGGLLAVVKSFNNMKIVFGKRMLACSFVGLACLVSYDGFYDIASQVADPLLAALFSFVIMGYLLENPRAYVTRIFSTKWLIGLGKISYGLYLWHYPFFKISRENFSWAQTFVLASLCSLLCAGVSYYFIEKPFLVKKKSLV